MEWGFRKDNRETHFLEHRQSVKMLGQISFLGLVLGSLCSAYSFSEMSEASDREMDNDCKTKHYDY